MAGAWLWVATIGVVIAHFQLVLFPGFHVGAECCNAYVARAAERHWYAKRRLFSTELKMPA